MNDVHEIIAIFWTHALRKILQFKHIFSFVIIINMLLLLMLLLLWDMHKVYKIIIGTGEGVKHCTTCVPSTLST